MSTPRAPQVEPIVETSLRPLSDAAKRALAEAAERRRTASEEARPREFNGRSGPDPVRYGDWEMKGRAVDF